MSSKHLRVARTTAGKQPVACREFVRLDSICVIKQSLASPLLMSMSKVEVKEKHLSR